MTVRESFFEVVPKPAKVIASVLFSLAVTGGLIVGAVLMRHSGHLMRHGHPVPGGHPPLQIFFLIGLLGGCIFSILALALGYVYGDARRRSMPAVPWVLIAALVPNLLGFLLYFVLRRPIASPCPQCGQAITPDQRFCSWCGYQRPAPAAPSGPAGLNPAAPTQF